MHGFGSWFEVEFSSIPDGYDFSPVSLSTSPWKPYVIAASDTSDFNTFWVVHKLHINFVINHVLAEAIDVISFYSLTHWKQDLMMMDEPLSVSISDRIEGKITITRNKIWRRHLRIFISFHHIAGGVQSNVSWLYSTFS